MTQLRLAYVNMTVAPMRRRARVRRSEQLSDEALAIAALYDRLLVARPSAGPPFMRLISNMVDEAEGRKL